MRKKLFILTQYYPPETGAPQTRLSELALGMKHRGWTVEVITALPNYPHGRIFETYRRRWKWTENIQGVPVQRYWLYASNSKKPFPRIVSMLSFSLTACCALPHLMREKPDYLLVESPPLTLGFSGWLLSRASGARLIFNVSDLWPLSAKALSAVSEGWFYRFLEALERFLYRRAFICTGQSEEIVAHLKTNGAKRTLLFRNGVDPKRFERPPEADVEFNKRPKLIYAGLLGVAQGILALCQSIDFQKLGVEFHLYGAGSERGALERYLAENPNRGIFLHGTVSPNEIPALLHQHDAALIALVGHIPGAVPSKIYEAMAAGLPIFFSGSGEGARIIEQFGVGWVNAPLDFSQLAAHIQQFLESPQLRQFYIQNCKKAALHFSRETQLELLNHKLLSHMEK